MEGEDEEGAASGGEGEGPAVGAEGELVGSGEEGEVALLGVHLRLGALDVAVAEILDFDCGGALQGRSREVGELVVGGVGVASGLPAECAGLGVEQEGEGGGLRDGPAGHLDKLPDGLLVEGGEGGVAEGLCGRVAERGAGGEED